MIKLTPTNGVVAATGVVPITEVFNTNNQLALSNNKVNIKAPGFLEVEGFINYTATAAGDASINLLVDGTVVATYSEVGTAAGDVVTIPIYNLLRIIPTNIINGFTNISFTSTTGLTISGGIITAKYIR